jgi:hypothetical protein
MSDSAVDHSLASLIADGREAGLPAGVVELDETAVVPLADVHRVLAALDVLPLSQGQRDDGHVPEPHLAPSPLVPATSGTERDPRLLGRVWLLLPRVRHGLEPRDVRAVTPHTVGIGDSLRVVRPLLYLGDPGFVVGTKRVPKHLHVRVVVHELSPS